MTTALWAMLVAAAWSDPTGRLLCDVPDTFAPLPDQPWRFTRADGLRQLVFLTVKPVPAGPKERARQLLEHVGASGITGSSSSTATGSLEQVPPVLAAAFAIAPTEPTWAGVLVLGPPAAAVAAEAEALAATCRRATPAVSNGRIWDTTRRSSASIPLGHETLELRGAGAVQAPGYTVRLIAVQPMTKPTLQEVAIAWLQPSGAKLTGTAGAAAGKAQLPVVVASGSSVQNGVEYVIEVAAIDFGNGEVGGFGVSTTTAALPRARATLDELLSTLTVVPRPVAPPGVSP